jgi:ferric-dicitrate binding protein FerR (iron transport regulator)
LSSVGVGLTVKKASSLSRGGAEDEVTGQIQALREEVRNPMVVVPVLEAGWEWLVSRGLMCQLPAQVLAWKRGRVVFDNVSLPQAVAEMNRYSATPISVADAGGLASLGARSVFRAGDKLGFARALAKLHGLLVRELPNRLELVPA